MSWQQYSLGEITNIVSGSTPKSTVPEYWDGGVAWATPTDLSKNNGKYLEQTERTISESGLHSCSARLLPKNSVLFSSRAPIGLVAINKIPMATNQGFKSFIPSERLDSSYLYWWLEANREQLKDLGNGATFKEVSKAVIARVKISLPSIEEQRRIAAILDKADGIRRKREQAMALADDFLRSLFLNMFGDSDSNPKGWNRRPFNELANIDTNMVDPKSEPYIDLMHIGPDVIEKKTGVILPAKTARQEGLRSGKYLFDNDHILYTKIRPYLQKVALPTFEGICSADVYPIRAIQGMATKEFLWSVLISPAYVAYFNGLPDRANIPKINMKEMNAYQCIAPPIEEQERFSGAMRKVMASVNNLERSLQKSSDLFASLSQRAFRGEL